jgi:hypothetical protein
VEVVKRRIINNGNSERSENWEETRKKGGRK